MARRRSERWPVKTRHQRLKTMISLDEKSNKQGKNEVKEAHGSASLRPTT